MRHRPCIFGKLHGAQQAYVFNAFHGFGRRGCDGVVFQPLHSEVLAELLVAKDGEALFERELEPVAASDAVASPVMEIFVTHDALDIGVVGVGCGGRIGQDKLGIENIQALVFHRAHVEVAGGDDHETLKV